MTHLTGKTAIVTGSARGIGRAIALRYATLGANVVINYSTDADNAERTVRDAEASGAQAIAVRADIADPAQLDALFATSIDRFGTVDIVVANAGLELIATPILDATDAQIDRLIAVNTRGAFGTLQKAGQHITDGGRIILIGSSSILAPVPGMALYSGTKLAARYFAEVLALELAPRGITVNSILPSAIDAAGVFADIPADAPFRAQLSAGRIEDRIGTAADVADAAEYLSSDLAAWVSGQSIVVTGGLPQ